MPISPKDAAKIYEIDKSRIESACLFIDDYLTKYYIGPNEPIVISLNNYLNSLRDAAIVAIKYKDAGWSVENRFQDMGNLIFTHKE